MALSSTTSRQAAYTGAGSTATYAYGFKIFDQDDLLVTVQNISTGALTTLVITTDYTVTGVGETSGGNVVLVNNSQAWLDGSGYLTASYKLHIRRKPALTQETDIRNQGSFYPNAHEDQFDKLIMIDQSQQDELNRSVKLPESITSSTFDPSLPVDIATADKVVIVNPSGNGFVMGPTADEIENAQANATAAAASAAAALVSETNAGLSETAAAASEVAAAASAASAAAALASAIFRDVVYVDNSDSPITIAQADNGKLYSIDSSSGAVSITLPAIAGLTLPFNVTFVLRVAGNPVTINRSSTDTIAGETSKIISLVNEAAQLVADTDSAPDDWGLLSFGSASSSSSSGSKTYIDSTSANIESSIGSWETDNGAGGAASYLTLTRNTTTPLAGTGDLSLAKSANDATGEFIKLDSQTIDIADRGGALFGSFSYDATDANYASGDLIVEVYDVTNAAVLYSGLTEDLEILKTAGKFQFVTYTESTTAQVELRIKINSTNATAYTVYFDEFKLGPAASVRATYKKSATVSANGSFTGGTLNIERVGNIVTIHSTADLTFASASQVASSTGLIPSWARPVDDVVYVNTFNASRILRGYVQTDGTIGIEMRDYAGTLSAATSYPNFNLSYAVPDEAGPTVNEHELSLKTVRVRGSSNGGTGLTANTTNITWTEVEDTHGAWNGTQFTAPKSGYYEATGVLRIGSTALSVISYIDTVAEKVVSSNQASAANHLISWSGYLSKGQVLSFRVDQAATLSVSANHWIEIKSLPDYTVLGVVKNNELLNAESAGLENYVITADQWGDLDSIELTPGEWDVDIQAAFYSNGATTTTNIAIGLGTVSGNTSPGNTGQDSMYNTKTTTSGRIDPINFFRKGITVTTPTTYYLKGLANGSITNLQIGYRISARRVK